MINSWSTTPGRPNGIWHLDMNTNYSTWFWDSAHQNHKQAQGFEYFDIDFGLSTHEPTVKGVPKGWMLPIRDVLIYSGAKFLCPCAGTISLMPGTSSDPAFRKVDVDVNTGKVQGLF